MVKNILHRPDSLENLIESDEEDEDNDGIRGVFHPKLRKHWKTILVATFLLVAGLAFLITGIIIQTRLRPKYEDKDGPNSYMFFLGAAICLIPGVYHVVYIYRAANGDKGYKMEDVTMFHE